MDGRTLTVLNVLDPYNRACLAIRVGRRRKAVNVSDVIEELLMLSPVPTHRLQDNGPAFMSLPLQDSSTGIVSGTASILPRPPWEKLFLESFNCRTTDQFL